MNILDNIKMILLFQLIYQLQNARSSFEDSGTDVDESQELNESKSNAASSEEQKHSHKHHHVYRAGHRHKKSHSHSHDHDHEHDHTHLRTTSNEYNEDCECSCSKCDPPSDCCKSACTTCPSGNPYQQANRGQPSVVFVPYPYPMMLSSPIVRPDPNNHETMRARETSTEPSTTTTTTTTTTTPSTTTTSTTTTTAATTTTEDLTDLINSQSNNNMLEAVLKSVVDDYTNIIAKTPEKLQNGNNKYMLTSLRRTKPTWMPKFGIVPITDNIAEKLLSKMSRNGVPLSSQQKRASVYDKSYIRTLSKKF